MTLPHISITLALQLATTTSILGLYATTTSLQEQKADHLSSRTMVLLVAFVLRYHPALSGLQEIAERPPAEIEAKGSPFRFFAASLQRFNDTGHLPTFALAARTDMQQQLQLILASPFAAIVALVTHRQVMRNEGRITHTAYRENIVSKFMVMLAVNLFAGFLLAELPMRRFPHLFASLLILAGQGALGCLAGFAVICLDQQSWKGYWSDRLMEVMAAAAHAGDHDLFNRALNLRNDIEAQPALPIPGKLGLYTTVYSIVQAVILFASKTLHSA